MQHTCLMFLSLHLSCINIVALHQMLSLFCIRVYYCIHIINICACFKRFEHYTEYYCMQSPRPSFLGLQYFIFHFLSVLFYFTFLGITLSLIFHRVNTCLFKFFLSISVKQTLCMTSNSVYRFPSIFLLQNGRKS